MSKMDFDLIQKTSSFINAIKDRQLDFRSLKLARIENLTLTKDQNDTLDFTDNDLRILENFPLMTRVKTLLCANNRIAKIELDMYKYLPNLRVLMLNNNHITELGDLIPLENLVKLQIVSILDNPVVNRKYYRQFIVHKCPSIRILDFERVTDAERVSASKLFQGPQGISLLAQLSSKQSEVIDTSEPKKTATIYQGPSAEDIARIRNAIKMAKSLEEISELEKMLQQGGLPMR